MHDERGPISYTSGSIKNLKKVYAGKATNGSHREV
jgi:hypothetical protein